MEDKLDLTPEEMIDIINEAYKEGLYSVRKKEGLDVTWELWGEFCRDMKMPLENAIRENNSMQHIKWLYALLQNRNQLISLHIETRLGKVHEKKELEKASKILAGLLLGYYDARVPCEICQKVDDHILKLATGQFDVIVKREIHVKDYPEEFRYRGPAAIITPKPKGTETE